MALQEGHISVTNGLSNTAGQTPQFQRWLHRHLLALGLCCESCGLSHEPSCLDRELDGEWTQLEQSDMVADVVFPPSTLRSCREVERGSQRVTARSHAQPPAANPPRVGPDERPLSPPRCRSERCGIENLSRGYAST